ncbi:MAG: type III-A CRISPR-associated protein Cas10/Csm1 [Caldicoprobacterales bacterium]
MGVMKTVISSAFIVTIGALLHDIGKVLYLAGSIDGKLTSISGEDYIRKYTQNRDILDCIRFHHRSEIEQVWPKEDSFSYIVYIADSIASGANRRIKEEGIDELDKNHPLESVFNLLNNGNGKAVYRPAVLSGSINLPIMDIPSDISSSYNQILSSFSQNLSNISIKAENVNSILELCELYFSFVPFSTYKGQISDISLFDHSKITAALASCIYLYLNTNKINNYKKELFEQEESFMKQKAFSLVSLDLSGIQSFIYTISSKGALKSLRSRSFYLEILLENTIDEILNNCNLSRANLLYSGGGSAYIILPNTDETHKKVKDTIYNINSRLLEYFGSALFIAYGWEACSANELMSKTNNPESYSNIFRSLSAQISSMKLNRYSADDIRFLNTQLIDKEGRECSICGVSSRLREREEGIICKTCASFVDISGSLIKPDTLLIVLRKPLDTPHLLLFSADGTDLFLCPIEEKQVKNILETSEETVVRIYSKNRNRTDIKYAKKLWMGDFAVKNNEGMLKTFEELANESEGIKRIGVLRADVDNLGTAFVRGFVRESDPENKYRYVNISRTATLSRSLSMIFKHYINTLLENPVYSLVKKKGNRNVVIVYSGGDDMFLVGSWDDVLAASLDIRNAFAKYTGGALTLSAGFSIFDVKYPISSMAKETEELEKRAKNHRSSEGQKNAISLFGIEMEDGILTDRHTYAWEVFENKVLGEKFVAIRALFTAGEDYGNAFLYNILHILRQAETDRINIARLVYLLARREPGRNAPKQLKDEYASFTTSLYKWALNREDRQQLITAIMIYIYTMRDKEENENG